MDKYSIGTGTIGDDNFDPDDSTDIAAPDPVDGMNMPGSKPIAPPPASNSKTNNNADKVSSRRPSFLGSETPVPDFLQGSNTPTSNPSYSQQQIVRHQPQPQPQPSQSMQAKQSTYKNQVNQSNSQDPLTPASNSPTIIDEETTFDPDPLESASDGGDESGWDMAALPEENPYTNPANQTPQENLQQTNYQTSNQAKQFASTNNSKVTNREYQGPNSFASDINNSQQREYLQYNQSQNQQPNIRQNTRKTKKRRGGFLKLLRGCFLFTFLLFIGVGAVAFGGFTYYGPLYTQEKNLSDLSSDTEGITNQILSADDSIDEYYNLTDTQFSTIEVLNPAAVERIQESITVLEELDVSLNDLSESLSSFIDKYQEEELTESEEFDKLVNYQRNSKTYVEIQLETFKQLDEYLTLAQGIRSDIVQSNNEQAEEKVAESIELVNNIKASLNNNLYSSDEIDSYQFIFYYFQFFDQQENILNTLSNELSKNRINANLVDDNAEDLANYDRSPVQSLRNLYGEYLQTDSKENLNQYIQQFRDMVSSSQQEDIPDPVREILILIDENTEIL